MRSLKLPSRWGCSNCRATLSVYAAALAVMVLLGSAPAAVYAGGAREEKAGEAQREEASRMIDVYVLHRSPAASGGVPRPAGEAARYLFQGVANADGAVRLLDSRTFAGPIRSREVLELNKGLLATHYRMQIQPNTPRSFWTTEEVRVTVALEELLSGGRVVFQPAQQAVVKAVRKHGVESGLVRVKSMSMQGGQRFTAVVEFARGSE